MPLTAANGLQIFYERSGCGGEPLLMIMGIGSQMVLWPEGFLTLLERRGFETLRFDNRDIGLSTKLGYLGKPDMRRNLLTGLVRGASHAPYTFEDMADDAAGLLDALEISSAHILGISMGGMIAQTFALAHPTRTRSLTSIMAHTGQRRTMPHPRALATLMGPRPKTREEKVDRMMRFFRVVGSPGYPFDENAIRERATKATMRSFYPEGFIRHFSATLASGARHERLRTLTCPTLIVHGTEDPLVPLLGGYLTASAVGHAETLWIDGMGHDLPEPVWGEIVDAIGRCAGL